MQPGPEQPAKLGHSDAFGGDRHEHPGQARARLAQLERVHRLRSAQGQLVRELRETQPPTHTHRIPTKLSPKHRIYQQPLDQLRGAHHIISG
jgi:hypothetical protein